MKKASIIYLIFSIFIGCSAHEQAEIPEHLLEIENLIVYSEDPTPKHSIELIREQTFGENHEVSMAWFEQTGGVGWFAGFSVDHHGRVYVGQYTDVKIHVFDSDGTYLKSLGQRGSGPGEYSTLSAMRVTADHLFVFDRWQFRLNIYSLESLALEKSVVTYFDRIPDHLDELIGWNAHRTLLRPDGSFIVGYMGHPRDARVGSATYNIDKERPVRFYFADVDGEVTAPKIFELIDDQMIIADLNGPVVFNVVPFPFLGKPVVSVSDHFIHTNWTEEFLIKTYNSEGEYLHAIYIPFERKTLNRDDILNQFGGSGEWNELLFTNAELPEIWPVIYSIITDDEDRLWISRIVESDEMAYEWLVLKPSGELITKFTLPTNQRIEAVKTGNLYILETEQETGQQHFVRYRFEMG